MEGVGRNLAIVLALSSRLSRAASWAGVLWTL